MKILIRILGSARQLWKYYVAISVFTVLLALMNLLQPLLSGWAIDEISKGSHASVRYAVLLAVGIFVTDLLANLFNNVGGYLGDQMQRKLGYLLSHKYFEHLLNLPQRFFDTELSGKIINRLNRSINQITNFFQILTNNFLQLFFTTIFTLAVVFHYSWPIGLMMLSVYPLYFFLTYRTSPKWREYQTEKNKHFDIALGRFTEAINQVKVVKSFLRERQELKFFDQHYEKTIDITAPQSRYWHTNDVYRRLVLNIIFFGIYLYIFVEGAHGNISPGVAVALILYGMQIRTPIFTISFLVDNFQRAVSDSQDYYEIMQTHPDITDHNGAKGLRIENGAINFDHVDFGCEKDTLVLKDITIAIEPHTKIALVGESGEGKTTLTNLLMRLYEPTSGRILIDGHDILDVTQRSLRENIGVVFQEPALFSGTIRENIAYGRPNASEEEVIAAAEAANAHEFITKFKNGYDSEIGERGLKLSGGQKQRIAIARALLKDAPILILDEATSSLDSRSEHLVQEALGRLMHSRTTIIIAHRLSTIQHVDQIITINKGRIDEIGTPQKLARSGGIYAQLLEMQQRHTKATEKKLKAYEIKED